MIDKSLKMTYNINIVIQSDLSKRKKRGDIMNLRELRKEKGFTQEQLANACGVQRTTITMIETENNSPSVELAKKLGEVLGIDWKVFFE